MHIEQQDKGWVIIDSGSQPNQPIAPAHRPGVVWTGASWSVEPHRAMLYPSHEAAETWVNALKSIR